MVQESETRGSWRPELRVSLEARPGWVRGSERVPLPGESIYCAAGEGVVVSIRGKTGDGSRLLEIRLLMDVNAKPFFAAASNVLVEPA